MLTATTQSQLDAFLAGRSTVLVPTMGYLHDGHLSLVRKAKLFSQQQGVPSVATIFVNPAQFNDPGDLARYPRDIERDKAFLKAEGLDAVVIPGVDEVYPPGGAWDVPIPDVARLPGLEDRFRPGHFEGVCKVLVRLFDMCRASAAVFGEKDWQQLQVARALVREQGLRVLIIPGETVREVDGLAMSSRNVHLNKTEHDRALAISRAIRVAGQTLDWRQAEWAMHEILTGAGMTVDYAVVREAASLVQNPDEAPAGPFRSIITARAGGVRLLDNGPWPGPVMDSATPPA